jgi:hypothetical protein
VDQHDVDVGRHGGQREGDRLLTLGATCYDGHRSDGGEQRAYGIELCSRRGHHDQAHRRRGGDTADRVDQQWLAGQQAQGLRTAGAQAQAGAGGRNEDRDVTPSIKLRGHVTVLFVW